MSNYNAIDYISDGVIPNIKGEWIDLCGRKVFQHKIEDTQYMPIWDSDCEAGIDRTWYLMVETGWKILDLGWNDNGGLSMGYEWFPYSKVKMMYKCRTCGEYGLRYSYEKCQCKSTYRGSPPINKWRGMIWK